MLISGLILGAGHGTDLLMGAMGQDSGDDSRLTLFVGIAAFSMLLQVLILVGAGIGGYMTLKKVMAEIDEIKGKVNPVIAKGTELAGKVSALTSELTPTIKSITAKADQIAGKVDTITAHGVEISGMVKHKVEEFGPTVTSANETLLAANQTIMDATTKTHEQLLRVNEMISQTLDATEKAGKRMVHNVTQPGREIAGLATGLKVAVKTFFDQQNRTVATPVSAPVPAAYSTEPYSGHVSSVSQALAGDKSNDIGL